MTKVSEVLRFSFPTDADYARFALSDAAPRYSILAPFDNHPELAKVLGISFNDALFSNDLDLLRRTALAWEENEFEVYIDRASNWPEYAGEVVDAWAIKGSPAVPGYFIELIFEYMPDELSLDMPVPEVEKIVREQLCGTYSTVFSEFDKIEEREALLELCTVRV